jgi:hypothetical protein
VIGGGIAFGVQFFLATRKERKIKEGFINLLISDIYSLLKLYNESIGEEIKKHNKEEIFKNYLRPEHNYFSVFDNNSDKILYLDDETSSLVVQFYNRAKAHIDTIYGYGKDFEDYRNLWSSEPPIQHELALGVRVDILGLRRKEAEAQLKGLFEFIKSDSIELKKMALTTISALKRQSKKYTK